MKDKSQEGKKIRETILRGSPLLEIFLNGNLGNKNDWVDDMAEPFTDLHNKLVNYYGNSFDDMLTPLKEIGDGFGLFDDAYPDKAKVLILNAVVIMGMEIRDKAVCHMFTDEIVKRLTEIRSFDAEVYKNPEKRKIAASFIKGVLWAGIAWTNDMEKNDPDEFSRFITGLDI